MVTILFHSTIFGPIHSRRLGVSLGINLSPNDGKICSFDCLYCEAGYNSQGQGSTGMPKREEVSQQLCEKLKEMNAGNMALDVITFSGNGEPTLHPQFHEIIDDTLEVRDIYYPHAKVSVLSNATQLDNPNVCNALLKVDNNILKLDSAINKTLRLIDQPRSPIFTAEKLIEQLSRFGKNCIVQTMMLRGTHNGQVIDNTTDTEIDALINAYVRIKPLEVMLYSIDRQTPEERLVKVGKDELESIASKIRQHGITVIVS